MGTGHLTGKSLRTKSSQKEAERNTMGSLSEFWRNFPRFSSTVPTGTDIISLFLRIKGEQLKVQCTLLTASLKERD